MPAKKSSVEMRNPHYNRYLFEQSPTGLFLCQMDGAIIDVNVRFASLLGYQFEEAIALTLQEIAWERTSELWEPVQLESLIKTGHYGPYQKEFFHKNGYLLPVKLQNSLLEIEGEKFVFFSVEALNFQQNAKETYQGLEEGLKENEEQFEAIFEQAALGIAYISLNGKCLQVNQRLCALLGYSREEMLKLTLMDLVYPEDREVAVEYTRQLLRGQIPLYSMEKRYRRKDDSLVWVDLTVSLARQRSGEPKYFIKTFTPITERKRLEEELIKQQSLFYSFFNTATAGLAIHDEQLRIIHINETLADINGVAIADSINKPLSEVLPHLAPTLVPTFQRIMATGEPLLDVELSGETKKQPGVLRHWIASFFPLLDVTGIPLGVGAVVVEITDRKLATEELQRYKENLEELIAERTAELSKTNEQLQHEIADRKQAEEALRTSEQALRQQTQHLEQTLNKLKNAQTQLIQSEKMSSLGQLVAGIAHEINNPINFIYGNLFPLKDYTQNLLELLQAYQQEYPHPSLVILEQIEALDLEYIVEDLPKVLSSIQLGADRIRDLVQSLRIFSRLQESEMKAVDIHEGLESTLLILQNRFKAQSDRSEIQVVKNYGVLPLVECYAGQLNQVFLNIFSNAIDAVETRFEQEKSLNDGSRKELENLTYIPRISVKTEVKEESVLIRISDNGTGINTDIQQRLFEPFFTTKPIGKGTGLGLAIAHSIIVQKHHGKIVCSSLPQQGTEFLMEIPIRQN